MSVRLLQVAQLELDEAIAYCDDQKPGLGNALLLEALAAIDRIRRFPKAWHPLEGSTRRCLLRRFPYGLIYHEDKGDILIVAVAHLHRNPEYWRDRLARP